MFDVDLKRVALEAGRHQAVQFCWLDADFFELFVDLLFTDTLPLTPLRLLGLNAVALLFAQYLFAELKNRVGGLQPH